MFLPHWLLFPPLRILELLLVQRPMVLHPPKWTWKTIGVTPTPQPSGPPPPPEPSHGATGSSFLASSRVLTLWGLR
jgi:hypothetical protein